MTAEGTVKLMLTGVSDILGNLLDGQARLQKEVAGMFHTQADQHVPWRTSEGLAKGMPYRIIVCCPEYLIHFTGGFADGLIDQLPEISDLRAQPGLDVNLGAVTILGPAAY